MIMKIKRFSQINNQEPVNEEYSEMSALLEDENFIAGIATIATFLGTAGVTLLRNLKGKSKKEQKEFLKDLREKLNRVTGAD